MQQIHAHIDLRPLIRRAIDAYAAWARATDPQIEVATRHTALKAADELREAEYEDGDGPYAAAARRLANAATLAILQATADARKAVLQGAIAAANDALNHQLFLNDLGNDANPNNAV